MRCFWDHLIFITGFEISLVRSFETSENDSRTSGIPGGLVRRTTVYSWFWHKLHWLYIFQTSEWYIQTSGFCNPLARRTSAFNLKFRSLYHGNHKLVRQHLYDKMAPSTLFHYKDILSRILAQLSKQKCHHSDYLITTTGIKSCQITFSTVPLAGLV